VLYSFKAFSMVLIMLVTPTLLDTDISMGLIRFKRLMRLATGALLVLWVHCVGAPRIAIGGCSHDVNSPSSPFHRISEHSSELLTNTGELSSERIVQGLPGPARQKRCSGLSCSSRDPLPSPTGLQFSEGLQHWGALAMLSALKRPSFVARRFDEPRLRACDQANLVFHPPRA
jgi:hypothetical protein